MSSIRYKKYLLIYTLAAILMVAPFLVKAVNDVTINGIVSFDLLTDTAAPTTVLASAGGQVTLLDVQSNYIDITLDNLSTITFNTTAPGQYLKITPASGPGFTAAPACITTTVTLTGTGATTVVRLEVTSTAPICPGGGGGHTAIYPSNYSVTINNNSAQTSSANVFLNLSAQNAVSVIVSNDPNFIGADWEAFTNPTDKAWTLLPGDGTKTVYVIYKSSDGNVTPILNDTISLVTVVTPPPPPEVPPVTLPPSPFAEQNLNYGDLFKGSTDTVYYYGADGKRHVFPNIGTYFSWYPDFSTVKKMDDQILAQITLGPNVTYKPGVKMVKIQSDPKVYAVDSHGVLRWIVSEEIAEGLYGLNWQSNIDDVSVAFFMDYTMGDPITSISDFNPLVVAAQSIDINTDMQLSL
jgi:hypothetical protein